MSQSRGRSPALGGRGGPWRTRAVVFPALTVAVRCTCVRGVIGETSTVGSAVPARGGQRHCAVLEAGIKAPAAVDACTPHGKTGTASAKRSWPKFNAKK